MATKLTAEELTARENVGELQKLIKQAGKGDAGALARVREVFRLKPELWDMYSDMASNAERILLEMASGEDLLAREAMARRQRKLRAELAGTNPTPLEKILVERVVLCSFQLYYFDALYAQGMKDRSWAADEHAQKRQDRAHRRFLSAVRTLALVRRLAVPGLATAAAAKEGAQRAEYLELGEEAELKAAAG